MARYRRFNLRGLLLWTGILVLVVAAFVLQALFASPSVVIDPVEAPMFVRNDPPAMPHELGPAAERALSEKSERKTLPDTPDYKALAQGVVLHGEPHASLVALLNDPDRSVRVLAARAVEAAILETIGAWDTRERFWQSVAADIEVFRSALYEALVDSAQNPDESNWIPYTLAWMPGQNEETLELLAWTANNHQSPEMRRSALFFVVALEPHSKLAAEVLDQRASDPVLRVRWEAFCQGVARWAP